MIDGMLNSSSRSAVVLVLACLTLVVSVFLRHDDVLARRAMARQAELNQVRSDLESDKRPSGRPIQLVPTLIALSTSQDELLSTAALRSLAELKSEAGLAVPALCNRLSDQRYWIRARVIDTLVQIGDPAVTFVRRLLQSRMAVQRAGAIDTLGRLNRFDISDAEWLVQDADPRVRASLARVLSELGQPALPYLIDLVADTEPAVAVAAANALKLNNVQSDAAIAALARGLARKYVGWEAATALASYRDAAQRTIPQIIAACPLGYIADRHEPEDAAEFALQQIGRPHPDDIPLIRGLLKHSHPVGRMLAAQTLAFSKANDELSACAIIEAVKVTANELQQIKQTPWYAMTNGQLLLMDQIKHFLYRCPTLFWEVTHDTKRFLQLVESIEIQTQGSLDWDPFSEPWPDLSRDGIPLIEAMLQHPNRRVRHAVLDVIASMDLESDRLRDLATKVMNERNNTEPGIRIRTKGSSFGGQFHGKMSGWRQFGSQIVDGDFAERPDGEILSTMTVKWEPVEREGIGNFCKLRGQLLYPLAGKLEPIDWFQGATVYLSRRPKIPWDWSKGWIRMETLISNVTCSESGVIEAVFDLRAAQNDRQSIQQFQIGISPAAHQGLYTEHTVTWDSRTPVIASTVRMIDIPRAPAQSHEIELINSLTDWETVDSTGLKFIRAVNALQRLGKVRAIQTLQNYVKLTEKSPRWRDNEFLFRLIRVLFEPIHPETQIPIPDYSGTWVFLSGSEEASRWPLYPMELVNDIPFILQNPGGVSHDRETPASHLEFVARFCVMRDSPLRPSSDPITAVDALLKSPKLFRLRQIARNHNQYEIDEAITKIPDSALGMVSDLLEPIPEKKQRAPGDFLDIFSNEFEREWNTRVEQAKKLRITWDPRTERFVPNQRKDERCQALKPLF
jgi:HEAT repeat protein